jgi:hypothetical protein
MSDHAYYLKTIQNHLVEKGTYSDIYIQRVMSYLNKNPDLAEEFCNSLPKGILLNEYIKVRGYDIRRLGATTLLSRSAIYVVLSRLREETKDAEDIIEEELVTFNKNIRHI